MTSGSGGEQQPSRGAVGDFELDGGVGDVEVVAELVIDALEKSLAFTEVHLDDVTWLARAWDWEPRLQT